jgi:threonine/homoserine/homoserine lactone efflux protein
MAGLTVLPEASSRFLHLNLSMSIDQPENFMGHLPSIAFVLASIAFIAAPGPDTMLLMSQGLAHGKRAAVGIAIGCAGGCLMHSLLAAVGISALLATSEVAFSALKWVGAGYLVYLGIRSLQSSAHVPTSSVDCPSSGIPVLRFVRRGFVCNATNPKVALFFLSFLPQFVDPSVGAAWTQIVVHGIAFALMLLAMFVALSRFIDGLGQWLRSRSWAEKALNRIAGFVCIALAVRLVSTSRTSH